jgi:hypothetical protein
VELQEPVLWYVSAEGENRSFTLLAARSLLVAASKATVCLDSDVHSADPPPPRHSGWYDAALSEKGVAEAAAGGAALKAQGFTFDTAHSSVLQRANVTCDALLAGVGQTDTVKVSKTWRLNERHYGGLTGLGKAETAEK